MRLAPSGYHASTVTSASQTAVVPPRRDENRFRRAFLLVLVLGISAIFLSMIRGFLLTILLAAIGAGLGHPLYVRLTRLFGGRRPLAALCTLLVGAVALVGPVAVAVYFVTVEALRLSESVGPWITRFSTQPGTMVPLLERLPFAHHLRPYQEQLIDKAGEGLSRLGGLIVAMLSNTTLGTLEAVFNAFMLAYTVFFLLLDGPQVLQSLRRFLPLREGERDLLLDKFISVTRATLKGTLVIGLVQGTLSGIAFWVAGIDHALFWGAVMVVLSVVPVLGGAIVWVPVCIFLAVTGDWVKAAVLAAFCSLVVGSVDNVLRPRLVGRDTEMHDLMILFSTLGGIVAFGAIGFIIGPIIAALFQTSWELFGLAFSDDLPPVDGASETRVIDLPPDPVLVQPHDLDVPLP